MTRCPRRGALPASSAATARTGCQASTGFPGADGTDGVAGRGRAFLRVRLHALRHCELPGESTSRQTHWGYDSPGLAGRPPMVRRGSRTHRLRLSYLISVQRRIEGAPNVGDPVPAPWETPSVVGRYGEDGAPGQDGIPGSDGVRRGARRGWGRFRVRLHALRHCELPGDSTFRRTHWGYDSPGLAGGRQWYDGAPCPHRLTLAVPDRRCNGASRATPNVGDPVPAPWRGPSIVGRYGADGLLGPAGLPGVDGTDGVPGADGLSYEYIFARSALTSLPPTQLPSNAWGFDEPGFIDGLNWYDGAPTLRLSAPNLHVSQRRIEGAPVVGAPVPAFWSTPSLVGHFGLDGADGD